jgi:hypothetical protein
MENKRINPLDIIKFKKDGGIIEDKNFKNSATNFNKFFFYNIEEEYDWETAMQIVKEFKLLNEKWRLPNWQESRMIYEYLRDQIRKKEGGVYYDPEYFVPRNDSNGNRLVPCFWIDSNENNEKYSYYFQPGYLKNDNFTGKSSKCRIILVA